MYHRTIFMLILMFAYVNCYATEVTNSNTQFNAKCPAQKLGPLIDNYYHECHIGIIKNEYNSCEEFVAVFKELMPEYDCARPIDMSGDKKYIVPAIWLLGYGQFSDYHALIHDLVFKEMYSSGWYAKARKEATALFFSEEFGRVLDAGGEVYQDEWNEHDKNKSKICPPPRFPLDVAPPPTLNTSPSTFLSLGSISIVFDKTTLSEAIKEIGAGQIQHQGDAAESSYWLCYSIRSFEGWQQLWLLSHGELGGPEHVIQGIAAKASSSALPTACCPHLPDDLRPVKLDNGLWLGAQTEEIIKKLGAPSLQQEEWLHYESKKELVGDPGAKAFRTYKIYERGGISVHSMNGKIIEIWTSKQTTD